MTQKMVAPTWVITCGECHGREEEKTIGIFRASRVEACEWCGRPISKGSGHTSQGSRLLEKVFERQNAPGAAKKLPQAVYVYAEGRSCFDPECDMPEHKALWDTFREAE